MENASKNGREGLPSKGNERKIFFLLYWAVQIIRGICGICIVLLVLSLLFSWGRWVNILISISIFVGIILSFLYNNYRTCPRCGCRVDYEFLKREPGDGLYCPHCRDTFSGKFFN